MESKQNSAFINNKDIINALLARGKAQEFLFQRAQRIRNTVFSRRVEIRSVIEYSNICQQACNYCGMNRYSRLKRYVLDDGEFLSRVNRLYNIGRRAIMIQTGENRGEALFDKLHNLLKLIKNKYPDLTLMCSLGNLSKDKYEKLKSLGIDRYLLKFETSDPALYKKVKPSDTLRNRLVHIKILKSLGFYVSSGNITGLPGQTLKSLADDLLLLKRLDLPMGSTSVFIPNKMSNYANYTSGDVHLALNFMAILRIMCPSMLIPSTSALELVIKEGQYLGLMAGANALTLHDGTPKDAENKYVIYKKDRYKPKNILFKIVKKAGLESSSVSLIREKPKNTLFYKLINNNLRHKKIAVYFEGKVYTYNDLLDLCLRFCSFLQNRNIKEGDVVLLALFDSIEFVIVFLSCLRLGIVVAPVDPLISPDQLDLILSESRPVAILATKSLYKALKDRRVLKIADDDCSEYFFSIINKEKPSHTMAAPDSSNPALILYTSGTTGKPKGVVHSYRHLSAKTFPGEILNLSRKDINLSYSRMHTSFGLGNSLLFPFHFGAGAIISRNIPNFFSLPKILKLKPTIIFAVPSIYQNLLDSNKFTKNYFSSVRLFISSGERLYSDTFKEWEYRYGKKLTECFGSSEMCHPFISNIPGKEVRNSCGKAIEGFEVKFSKDSRMLSKGPTLFSEYIGDPELTKEKLANGWFKSDDFGYVNEKGNIFLKGRDNQVFKANGKWVSAVEIEDKLRGCRLVREAAVVKSSNGLEYYISLRNDIDSQVAEKQMMRYCKMFLRIHELPKKINFLDELPKTRSGKIKMGGIA